MLACSLMLSLEMVQLGIEQCGESLESANPKKQRLLNPAGEVRPEFLKEAWKQDQKSTVKLKVMPKLSYVHLHPNGFEKMRVNIAFQLFGDEVIKGLSFYSEEISVYGEPKPTVDFIKRINNLIKVMTSRTPKTALRNGSSQSKSLLDFVEFINKWEESSKAINCLGYLSKSTALGLKAGVAQWVEAY
ncbi:hypothetical protein JTE90_003468 [Oedothorax gibbosus]|uniref:Transposable element P transposase-like GTP-binding insertion domain-containing protein n=1 Tax=Oedothorax gibbosus TaxID=931172 RepID=A0AAV6U3V3_9ARAC|nr:hypothetical protein JTE90_003468 [Oedothorax gibbosus]